jgi:hypothetical protein
MGLYFFWLASQLGHFESLLPCVARDPDRDPGWYGERFGGRDVHDSADG